MTGYHLTRNHVVLEVLRWMVLTRKSSKHSNQPITENTDPYVTSSLWNFFVSSTRCCFLKLSLFSHNRFISRLIPAIACFVLFCFQPREAVAHCSQLLVDGPCHVLFSRELQQLSIDRCFCGLCGARGLCACCCGAPHVCSHLLWTYSVAGGCRGVDHPRSPGY